MNKIFRNIAALLTLSISACVSQPKLPEPMPTTEIYNSEDESALVIIRDDGTQSLYNRITDFRKVDLENSMFVESVFSINKYNQSLSDSEGNRSRFYVIKVPPGDYTRTLEATFSHKGVVKTCFSKGTTVYRLEAGKINYIDIQFNSPIIPAINSGGNIVPDYENTVMTKDKNLKYLQKYLPNYTGFKAEFMAATPVANIHFNGSGNDFLRTIDCPNEKNFEIDKLFNI